MLRHKILAFLALLIWLTASLSGAHGHLCFDGQEPPISIHMEMLDGHVEHDSPTHHHDSPAHHHDSSTHHVDADIDIGKPALAKLIKLDLPLLIAAAILMTLLFETRFTLLPFYRTFSPPRLSGVLPPLRAPPVLPA